MEDETKVVSMSDHKEKVKRQEEEHNRETSIKVNPNVSVDVLDDLNACIDFEDLEATLRVFSLLRTLGDEVTIKIDHSDITIMTTHDTDDDMDAGVDFPEQVIKRTASSQMANINFTYDNDNWDDLEEFITNTSFSLRRCIESLTYWGTGEKDD